MSRDLDAQWRHADRIAAWRAHFAGLMAHLHRQPHGMWRKRCFLMRGNGLYCVGFLYAWQYDRCLPNNDNWRRRR